MACRSSIEARLAGGVVIAILGLLSAPAHAVETDDSVGELLRAGVEQRRAGHDAEALATFKRAQAIAPSPRIDAQIGLAEQSLNMWLEAEEDLSRALAAEDDAWVKRNRDTLVRAARLAATKLGWVTVRSNAPNATLFVGGRSLGSLAAHKLGRTRVVAGQVTIELRAEGREPAAKSIVVVPETEMTVTLDLRDSAPSSLPVPPRSEPAPSSPRPWRTVGWISLGVGAASLGVGTFFGIRAMSLKSDRDADCAGGCSASGVEADQDGRAAGLVSTITVLGGVAAAGVGTFLLFSTRSGSTTGTRVSAGPGTLFLDATF